MTRRLMVAAVFFLALISQLVIAQAPTDQAIEFYGTIQSANSTALVINGQLVDSRAAQINTPLLAGLVVRVRATFLADGSITATQIDPVSPGVIPGIVEIEGAISALSDTSLLIGTQTIDISTAQVNGTLVVGQIVRVYALQAVPGVWTARTVLVIDSALEVVVTPEVFPLPTDISATLAAPLSTPEITPSGAALEASPQLVPPVATPEVIAPVETREVGEDFRIEGTLQAFDANTITVDGYRYFIGSARIDDPLTVGARVRLEIRIINDGEWIVEKVEVRD